MPSAVASALSPGRNGSSVPPSSHRRAPRYGRRPLVRAIRTRSWRAKSSASSNAPGAVSPPESQTAAECPPTAQNRPGAWRGTSKAPKPPIETADGKGTQTRTYDPIRGLLTKLEDSQAGTFTAAYNADDALVSETLPNGVV